jgi:GDP-L-fucose synthase
MKNFKRVFIAGHNGMVGSSIYNEIKHQLPDIEIIVSSRSDLDLTNQKETINFIKESNLDAVIIAAAKVGGIYANNTYPADFIYDNLMIELNLIHGCHEAGIANVLFLGSSCIYPKESEQPIKEDKLLTGPLETTNEPYAVAKIAGIKLCESYNRQHKRDYRCVMPCNLYGLNDNYHPENSHVIPALIRRFHEAKINEIDSVEVWGTGRPLREFLFSTDLARACIHVMGISKEKWRNKVSKNYSHLNIGSGTDISIENLTSLISSEIGFKGDIIYNSEKPDGTIKKLLDSSLINSIGWMPEVSMQEGIRMAYKDFLNK